MAITWQRRVVPGRCVGTLTCCWISRAWSLGEPRGYDDGRRVVRVVVPMGERRRARSSRAASVLNFARDVSSACASAWDRLVCLC